MLVYWLYKFNNFSSYALLEIIIIKFSFPVCFRLKLLYAAFNFNSSKATTEHQWSENVRKMFLRKFWLMIDLTFNVYFFYILNSLYKSTYFNLLFLLITFHRRNYANSFDYLMKLKTKDSTTNNHNNIIILTILSYKT